MVFVFLSLPFVVLLSLATTIVKGKNVRLTVCVISMSKSRVHLVEHPLQVAKLFGKEHIESMQLFLENLVCFKVFMMANLLILEGAIEKVRLSRVGFWDSMRKAMRFSMCFQCIARMWGRWLRTVARKVRLWWWIVEHEGCLKSLPRWLWGENIVGKDVRCIIVMSRWDESKIWKCVWITINYLWFLTP